VQKLPHPQDLSNTDVEWLRQAVYDEGGDRIGHVVKYRAEVTAFNRRGQPVGVFGSIAEAAKALWRNHRGVP
jgi:hypothetical protein